MLKVFSIEKKLHDFFQKEFSSNTLNVLRNVNSMKQYQTSKNRRKWPGLSRVTPSYRQVGTCAWQKWLTCAATRVKLTRIS